MEEKDKIENPKKNNYTSITTHLMGYMLWLSIKAAYNVMWKANNEW